MKKILSFSAAVIFIMTATITVFAGGHCRRTLPLKSYSVCTIESCVEEGLHIHSGKTYLAHSYNDGHDYHDYCDFSYCTITDYHEHDGVYCFGHTIGDGHNHRTYKSKGRHH